MAKSATMTCDACGESKPAAEFREMPRLDGGRSPWCDACARDALDDPSEFKRLRWRRAYRRLYYRRYMREYTRRRRWERARAMRWEVRGVGDVAFNLRTGAGRVRVGPWFVPARALRRLIAGLGAEPHSIWMTPQDAPHTAVFTASADNVLAGMTRMTKRGKAERVPWRRRVHP